jgi:ATP-dependent metalloprotease
MRAPTHVSSLPMNIVHTLLIVITQFLGALRVTSQHPPLVHPFVTSRALSTLVSHSRPNVPRLGVFKFPVTLTFNTLQRRPLSLGSIFGRKPTQSPSPQVVAHITRLEAEANVQPHDVPKQLALYQALTETKLKSSYELIITRWERMCEFVRVLL